jgi:thiamine biosynthesis lipoprotein
MIAISAGALTLGGRISTANATDLHEWHGSALGAAASIRLAHDDSAAAQRLIEGCVAEIARLERLFSLYDPWSEISRLNRAGGLDEPSLEMVELLGRCAGISELTLGRFDITVQPLFRRYADHFTQADADPAGPSVEDLLPLVDWRGVQLSSGRISLARPGMAITLNGIAQGFITDRIADRLRAAGMTDVLVDIGELRALGHHPAGRPWRVGIRQGRSLTASRELDLADAAMATSSGWGSPFEGTGRCNHLLDPATGRSADPHRTITVIAAEATLADGLATAFTMMTPTEIEQTARQLAGVRVLAA